MAEIRSIVNQVLSQLGTSREARYYLKQYSEDDLQFAVIKVGGAVLEEELQPLASALAFLANLGLMPIILHGAGPQLDVALEQASIPTVKRKGLRVTTPEVMEVARPVIYRANRSLVSALEDQGVRAAGIQHGAAHRGQIQLARPGECSVDDLVCDGKGQCAHEILALSGWSGCRYRCRAGVVRCAAGTAGGWMRRRRGYSGRGG